MKRLVKIVIGLVLTIFSTVVYSPITHAQSIIFEEDFSENFTKWTNSRGETIHWSIVNETARVEAIDKGSFLELVPKDQYWKDQYSSYVFEFDYNPVSGVDKNLAFGVVDDKNWYQFHFTGGKVITSKIVNGRRVFVDYKNHIIRNNNWYQIKIIFDNEKIALIINDVTVVDLIDHSYNGETGKIALRATNGSTTPTVVEFDNIKVTLIEDEEENPNQLDVPSFSQNANPWGPTEYNLASQWTPWYNTTDNSFNRWACKLVSDVMVMSYHGISTLPNDESLDPATYNSWLLNNNGFSFGNVSPNAVSDIAEEHNDNNPDVPNLEYATITSEDTTDFNQEIFDEIEDENPVTIQLQHDRYGSHFVVATGFSNEEDPDEREIFINDPEEIHNTLSGYTNNGYWINTLRTYQPSFTDLSGWYFLSMNLGTQVVIEDMSGNAVSSTNFTEGINSPENPLPLFPTHQEWNVSKPETGQYLVTITNQDDSPVVARVVDHESEVLYEELSAKQYNGVSQYILHYFKDADEGESYFEPVLYNPDGVFAEFRASLAQYLADGEIYEQEIFDTLYELSLVAEDYETAEQAKAALELKHLLDKDHKLFSNEARKDLHKQLVIITAKLNKTK